jgi:hypothetical protein
VRLWPVPNARGNSEYNLFKNAKGRLLFLLSPQVCVCRCQSFYESRTCPSEKSLLENCQSFFETEFCPATLTPTLGYSQWGEFEARHCLTTPNVFCKLNYKFTLSPAIGYSFCCGLLGFIRYCQQLLYLFYRLFEVCQLSTVKVPVIC